MRNKGRILILLVGVAVLFGLWFFINRLPEEEIAADAEASDYFDAVELVPFSQLDMTRIVMETPEGTINLERKETTQTQRSQQQDGSINTTEAAVTLWVSEDIKPDQVAVSELASAGGHFRTMRRVVESATPEDLSDFGFDQLWKVTFYTATEEASVIIGDETPDGNAFYVMTPDNDAIYTAGAFGGERLKTDRLGLTDKNLYGRVDTLHFDITALRFYRGGDLVLDATLGDDTYWQLTEPVAIRGDIGFFREMQLAFAGLTIAEHVAAADGDLAQFGLDAPEYVFNVKIGGNNYELQLGGRSPENNFIYARINHHETVFTINPAALIFLDKPFVEMIERFVFLPTIFDVEHMTVTVDGRTDVMQFDVPTPAENPDGDLPETFILNGEKLEGDESISGIKRYYQGAISIRADRVDFEAAPEYTPELSVLTIDFVFDEAIQPPMRVELIPTPDSFGFFAFRNGEYSGLVVSRTQMDEDSMGIRQGYIEMMEKIEADRARAKAED